MSREVMQQALEYVQEFKRRWWAVPPFGNKVNKATREAVTLAHVPIFQIEDALRRELEKPADEPVAWGMENVFKQVYDCITPEEHARVEGEYTVPLYRGPQPAAQWVGLTEEEVKDIVWNMPYEPGQDEIRAIEAKLKEKNT